MSGPGNCPLARTAALSIPSGETSALTMVKSVTGPIAASESAERLRATNADKARKLNMLV